MDSSAVQRAFAASLGGIPYPLLADFHPRGAVAASYSLYNEERGTSRRAIVIVDREGVIRYRQVYAQGLPDPQEVLTELERL